MLNINWERVISQNERKYMMKSAEITAIKQYKDYFGPCNFTLIITHMDRLDFLERLLGSQNFPFNVLIADASQNELHERIDSIILKNISNFKVSISCIFFKAKSDLALTISTAAKLVKTDYCSLVSEDDLVDGIKLQQFTELLDLQPELSVVIGKFIYFTTFKDNPGSKIRMFETTSMCKNSYLQETIEDRFIALGTAFPRDSGLTTFGVMRSSLLAKSWHQSTKSRLRLNHKMSEVLASHIAIASGKILVVDEIFCYRQMHSTNNAHIAATRYIDNQNFISKPKPSKFEDWEATGVSNQIIGLGESLCEFINDNYSKDFSSVIKIAYTKIWPTEIVQTLNKNTNPVINKLEKQSLMVSRKIKIRTFIFSLAQNKKSIKLFGSVLYYLVHKRLYLRNLLNLNASSRKSLKNLRSQLKSTDIYLSQ